MSTDPDRTPTEVASPAPSPRRRSQHLSFLLAEEEYALGILQVREIIEYRDTTRVPTSSPWVRGVINLRGSVVPVIDLGAVLGLPERQPTSRSCVVIVELEHEQELVVVGLLTDRVQRVIELDDDEIQPCPAFGTRVQVDHLSGMAQVDSRFVMLLDIERIFALQELSSVPASAPPSDGLLATAE